MEPQIYQDIDWKVLRANALEQKGWASKNAEDWDKKAGSFAGRNKDNTYVTQFLSHLPLENSFSVLDIGCGPGTLALPIAPKVRTVTAVDFSAAMLRHLEQGAKENHLRNITTCQCSWEDDWTASGIEPHDIAIASRSMGVKDLARALQKIDSYAKRYAFISDRVGATPFEQAAFEAIGRSFAPGPDYIYTVNTLYSMGIHPNINILTLEKEMEYPSMEAALQSYRWMFHELNAKEEEKLQVYISGQIERQSRNSITIRRNNVPRWALLWWRK